MSALLAAPTRIDPTRAVLLLIDFQERLAAVMPTAQRLSCERNITMLLELARRLQIPVVVSEQYSKGLGPTVQTLQTALEAPDLIVLRMEKMEFACTDAPAWSDINAKLGTARTQFVVVGMETHVCVYQTVRGLRNAGHEVHVPKDAVISRREGNFEVGLQLIDKMGAFVSSTEVVIFDALKVAGTDDFKAMSRLVK